MKASKLKYTILKNNIFYLNFRINYSQKIIRLSLLTDSKRQATYLINHLMPTIYEIKKVGDMEVETTHKISVLVKILSIKIKHFAESLMMPNSNITDFVKSDFNHGLDKANIREGFNQDHLASKNFLNSGEEGAETIVATIASKDDPYYQNAIRAAGYVFHLGKKIGDCIEAYDYEGANNHIKSLDNYTDSLFQPTTAPKTHEIKKEFNTPLFSEFIKKYIESNTGNKGKKWNDEILKVNIREFAILLVSIGDLRIGDITGHILDDAFNDVIKGLPMANKKPYIGMSSNELVEVSKNNEIEDFEDVISSKTASEYKKKLQGLFVFAKLQRYIKTSPTDDMLSKFDRKNDRGAFTNSEIKRIYSFCKHQKEDWKQWCIPLMIYTGCRNNEITQLTIDDVKRCEDSNIYYLHINQNDNKKVKTKAGIRQVPIHSDILEEFLAYKDTCKRELFPNTTSKTLTRFYHQIKVACNLPTTDEKDNKLALYSTRHSFITELLQHIESEMLVQEIVGHKAIQTVTKGYFKGFTLVKKKEALEKLIIF